MARYKVLKSVAHSIGHSFASTLNYDTDDYVMGHLLRRAREVREPTLLVDLLTGEAGPGALMTAPLQRAVARYVAWLPDLVHRHFSDMVFVSGARMTVQFDLAVERPNRYAPACRESPFVIRVEIEDDRGKRWVAEQKDWWFPEPPEPLRIPLRRRTLLRRVREWIHRLRFGTPLQIAVSSSLTRAWSGHSRRATRRTPGHDERECHSSANR
jgi:hypothetical protein